MHIRKNICKIPYWGFYCIQDLWIKRNLKKINHSRIELEKAESKLQRQMLSYCWHAFPEYHRAMGIRKGASLEEYPLLSRHVYYEHPEWFHSAWDRWFPISKFSTSGSTGTPFAFYITPNHAPVHQRMLWNLMGYKKGDKIVSVNGDNISEEQLSKNIYSRMISRKQLPYGGYGLSSLYLSEKTEKYFLIFWMR